MKKLAFAFFASLLTMTAAPAMADESSCTTLQGLSGEYCPVKAKRSQLAKLLDQGCVQIARNGIVVQTPYCPAAMFQATAVVASIAPTDEGSDNDNGDVGGDSDGGEQEAGGVSSDGGDSSEGDSEAGGTAGGDGDSAGGDQEAGGVL